MDTHETGAQDVVAKIETYSDTYRATAKHLHELIMATAPQLQPRLWYGMPGYALKRNGPVILFFREDNYISFGFTESANLKAVGNVDENLVASAWYLTQLNDDTKATIVDIVQKVITD
jgi:hypothetical protein